MGNSLANLRPSAASSMNLAGLIDLARRSGGECTMRLAPGRDGGAQGAGDLFHRYKQTYGPRWTGITSVLGVQWIAAHANDRDFWNWLQRQGGWDKIVAANNALVHDGAMRQPHVLRQKVQQALSREGLVPRAKSDVALLNMQGRLRAADGFGSGRVLAAAIAPNHRLGTATYRLVDFLGANSGHSVALWTAEDVVLFDPNFGEFWFRKVADFRDWFAHYWVVTGYTDQFGDCHMSCWGKSISK